MTMTVTMTKCVNTKTDDRAKKQNLGREGGGKRKGIGQDNDG
jgi:hypothetical protein